VFLSSVFFLIELAMAITNSSTPTAKAADLKPMIGIVGVGNMGLAIAKRLISQGYSVLAQDIDPARQALAQTAGATVMPDARSLAQQADVILIVVLDADQIAQVLGISIANPEQAKSAQGLLTGLEINPSASAGRCPAVLMCSTIAPEMTQQFAQILQAAGAWAIDAPISGGPLRAEQGTMSMMLAADPAALAQVQLLTQAISAKQFQVSHQVGDAMRAKLVNNMMAAANLVAASEAMGLAAAFGLDLAKMAEIVKVSSGQSWMCDDRIARALVDDYEPRAHLHVLTKDVKLAHEAAQRLAVAVPMGQHAAQTMQAACHAGHRNDDDAIMFQYWAETLNVE
jgi:L-threonate 2-dehydrogenase